MLYKIEPLPVDKWHGLSEGDTLNTSVIVYPYVDPDTMKYRTGLTEKDIEWLRSKGIKDDLSDDFDPNKPHPFWESPRVATKLPRASILLDSTKPYDFIKIKYLQQHPIVAKSLDEWKSGLADKATHYFVNSMEQIAKKAAITELKANAYAKLLKLSRQEKLNIVTILSGKNFKNISDDELQAELGALIEKDPEAVLDLMKDSKERVTIKAIVQKAVSKGIIKKGVLGYKYFDIKLGQDIEDAVDFLSLPENEELLAKIESMS